MDKDVINRLLVSVQNVLSKIDKVLSTLNVVKERPAAPIITKFEQLFISFVFFVYSNNIFCKCQHFKCSLVKRMQQFYIKISIQLTLTDRHDLLSKIRILFLSPIHKSRKLVPKQTADIRK